MPELGPEIGATLRETRMRARIDIGEVELRTKIRAKYLRAIENEEWDLLPGPIYVKSFLRTYGEYLGLDSRLLVDEYKRRYEFGPGEPHRPLSAVKRERERERERASRGRRGPGVPSWLIILLVLVCAGVALFFIGRHHDQSTPKSARGINSATQTTPHTVSTPVTTTTVTHTTPAAATVATLKLVPTESVWVCVENGSGDKLVNGVVESAGSSIPSLKGGTLLVTLGNASVTVTANGKPYALASSSSAIGLKISPKGVTKLPQGPTCA